MPAPSTNAEFVELVRRSGVLDDERLSTYLEQVKSTGNAPSEPNKFATQFIRDGLLTYFQAEQFLQGKWKRFNIGKYRVLEKIGTGGMGQVFLCEHKLMRRRVAIKVLPTAKAEDPSSLERFYREARAVAALDHPNLVRAFDVDEDQSLNFLVMEYVDGASFHELIKKNGPLDPLRAAHYFHQSAMGLDYAHQVAGLVHRDIKPGNILVDRTGTVKILDMGLARFFNDESDVLTRKYDENVLGTADYLAPEQAIDSHSVDIRADIYSLGATLYYVLAGSPPFPDGSVAQKLLWHQTKPPRPIQELRPELPDEFVYILERMMKKDRAARFQSPAELVEALEPLTSMPIPPPPDSEMPQLSLAAMTGAGSPAQAAARASARPSGRSSGTVTLGNIVLGTKSGSSCVLKSESLRNGAPESPARGMAETLGTRDTPSPTNPFGNLIGNSGTAKSSLDVLEAVYSPSSSSTTPAPIESPPGRRKIAPWIAFATVLTIAAGGAGYYYFGYPISKSVVEKSKEPVVAQPQVGTWIVNPKGGKESLRSVADAVRKAQPGDRIILQTPTIEETLTLDSSNFGQCRIVIESGLPDGKPVVWTAPAGTPPNQPILALRQYEGLTIRNVVFDGRDEIETPIHIAGRCPGVVVENVGIRRFSKTGLRLDDAQGEPDRPIVIKATRFQPTSMVECALRMNSSHPTRALKNIQIVNCQFDAASLAIALGEGSASDLKFERNRFYNADAGFRWRPLSKEQSLQVRFLGNTFSNMRSAAVHLESAPPNDGNSVVQIEQSLFVKVGSVFTVNNSPTVPFANAINNVRDDKTADGQLPQPSRTVQVSFQSLNPNDEMKFLRYPLSSSLLTLGSNGGPVGSPPVE